MYSGEERRQMSEHQCKFEKTIMEMAGDVKVLASEFKAMNGSLRETKRVAEEHVIESKPYREKVSVIWSTIHTVKWAIMLVFGSGLIWRLIEFFTKGKV